MQLDEFVREVLVQVCKGVSDAKAPAMDLGARVNPTGVWNSMEQCFKTTVEFDVAITSETVAEGGGKAKLAVFNIGADLGASRQTTDSTTNRIKFSVPVVLPHTTQDDRRQ